MRRGFPHTVITASFAFLLTSALLFGCAKKVVVEKPSPPVAYTPAPPPEAAPVPPEPVAQPAGEAPPGAAAEKDPFADLPRKYRLKALEAEKNRDWGKALLAWKVVEAFAPADPDGRSKMDALNARIGGEAERHFRRGIQFYERNAKDAAGKELAAAVALQPEHKRAVESLRRIFAEPDSFEYRTVEGDTGPEISRKMYHRPDLWFLIAYFNDLDAGKTVKPGMTLKAPAVKPELIGRVAPKEMNRKPAGPPKTGAPGKLEKDARYSPQEAEAHYDRGVKHFLADELEKAIQEWEEAVRLNPDHPRAARDLNRAKGMMEKLKPVPK